MSNGKPKCLKKLKSNYFGDALFLLISCVVSTSYSKAVIDTIVKVTRDCAKEVINTFMFHLQKACPTWLFLHVAWRDVE